MGRSSSTPRRVAAGALAVLVPISAAVTAQTETFEEETSVVLVEIPLQVVRDGRSVAGLTADDFEVYVRGEKQPIVGFEAFDFRRESATTGSKAGPLGELAAARRNLLFLLDFAYPSSYDPVEGAGAITAAVHGLERNLEHLRRVADSRLGANDRWSVAFFSPLRGVKLVREWTDDPGAIRRGLDLLEAAAVAQPEAVRAAYLEWRRDPPPEGEAGALTATLDDLVGEARTAISPSCSTSCSTRRR